MSSIPEFTDFVATESPVASIYDYILDGTKVGWWRERVEAWNRGERIAPITMDVAWTRKCNAACSFCVFPDTPVLMADGSTKRMIDVRPGDSVASVDEFGKPSVSVVTSHWQTAPRKRGLHIETQFGKLECTADHLVLTDSGWVRAGDLRKGDYVHTSSNNEEGTIGTIKTHEETESGWIKHQSNARRGKGNASETDAREHARERKKTRKKTATRSEESHEAAQSDEISGNRSQNAEDAAAQVWKGFSFAPVQTIVERRKNKGPTVIGERESTFAASDDGKQPHEESSDGGEGEGKIYAGVAKATFRENERNLEIGEDHAGDVQWKRQRQRSEQDGEETFSDIAVLPGPVRRRREVLDQSNAERNMPESGFYFWERQTENGFAGSRDILASRSGCSSLRDYGLRNSGVECFRPLDKAYPKMDDAIYQKRNTIVAGRSRILSIGDAGYSPVYDLECWPYHNFVAGGIVVHNCFAQMQASEGGEITKELAFSFLDDAAEIGVKGISLISDGESTVVPWYEESIEHAARLGIKIGIGTNGVRLKRKVLERILPHISYLRYNFSAGEMQRYKQIMGLKERDYWQVIQNVRDTMEIVRRDKLKCTVNMQMVTMPEFHDQIMPLTELASELRPHYLIFKHCSDNDTGFLGVDYKKYDELYDTFKKVELMGDKEFRVVVKWARLADEGKRHYSRCLGPPFQLQMSGNGLVSSCGFHFNEKFRKFHMGWIAGPEAARFKEIWRSERYWDVINYLASDEFDPRERCGTQCLQTHTNQWLFDYQNNKVDFPITPAPPDMEFL